MKSVSLRSWLILVFHLLCGLFLPAHAAEIRYALMNFTSLDNAYSSLKAAGTFSTLLQPLLTEQPGIAWVERNELCSAREELELSQLQASRGSALQCGRWSNAERLVIGRFYRSESGDWKLDLEIVEVSRAETLAARTLTFPGTAATALEALHGKVSDVAREIGVLHASASEAARQLQGKITIAPLFLFGVGSRLSPFQTGLEEIVLPALETVITRNPRLHLISLQRANRAKQETELLEMGLSDAAGQAWRQTADAFIWGTYTNVSPGIPRRTNGPTVTLCILRQSGVTNIVETLPVTTPGSVSDAFQQALQRLAERVVDAAAERALPVADSGAERRIAAEIVELVTWQPPGAPARFSGPKPDLQAIQMLELACFLDPSNARAQEERIRLRFGWWANWHGQTQSEFWSKWNRSEAWARYVDQFGFHPAGETNTTLRYAAIAGSYVQSLAEIFRPWNYYNRVECCGFPAGVPSEVEARWRDQAEKELARRVERAVAYMAGGPTPEDRFGNSRHFPPPPRGYDWLFRHLFVQPEYVPPGQPPKADHLPAKRRLELLEQLWPAIQKNPNHLADISTRYKSPIQSLYYYAGRQGQHTQLLANVAAPAAPAPPEPLEKPPWPTNSLAEKVALHEFPGLDFSPPELNVPVEAFHFPGAARVTGVTQVDSDNERLWLVATDERPENSPRVNPELASAIQSERSRLWTFDLKTRRLGIYAPLEREPVVAFERDGKYLWLAGDRVSRFDTERQELLRFGVAEGLVPPRTFAISKAADRWFAVSGLLQIVGMAADGMWREISTRPTGRYSGSNNDAWLVGSGDWLGCRFDQTILYNARLDQWTNIQFAIDGLAPPGYHSRAGALARGTNGSFWIGSPAGLHWADPTRMSVKSWPAQGRALSISSLRASSSSHSYPAPVWESFLREESIYVFARHRLDAHRWSKQQRKTLAEGIAPRRLSGAPSAMAADGEWVWLASSNPRGEQRLPVFHAPSESWLGSIVPPSMVRVMHVTKNDVWLGMSGFADRPQLGRVSKQDVLALSRSGWVADRIPDDDIARAVQRLPARERMLWHFHRGEHSAALELAKTGVPGRELECLFVEALCHDLSGLDNTNLFHASLGQITNRYPDSPWSRTAERLPAWNEQQRRIQQWESHLLEQFDADGDGVLDARELEVKKANRQFAEQEQRFQETERKYALDGLFRELDADQDGRLVLRELERSHPVLRVNPSFRPSVYAPWLSSFSTSPQPGSAAMTLQRFDQNQDKAITREEMMTTMATLDDRRRRSSAGR